MVRYQNPEYNIRFNKFYPLIHTHIYARLIHSIPTILIFKNTEDEAPTSKLSICGRVTYSPAAAQMETHGSRDDYFHPLTDT